MSVQLCIHMDVLANGMAIEHHVFRLPHGDQLFGELIQRVRQVGRLAFELYGALTPAQVRDARDALVRLRAVERDVISSLPECRRRPETARRLLAHLAEVLDACGKDRSLVIGYQDGVWDEAPDCEPIETPTPPADVDDDLRRRLARIARGAADGRISMTDYNELLAAVRGVGRPADFNRLLDLAELLASAEEKL